jgi:glycosyltransferase involved in cell wall biosynthesis
MKIVHIVESFAGGVYDFILDLVNSIPEEEYTIIYAEREHTPENFKIKFPKNVSFIQWTQVTREINPIQDFKAYIELIEYLKKIQTDVIHLHSSKAGFLGRIAAYKMKLSSKVVYTPHGVSFLRKDVSPVKHRVFVWLEKTGSWFGGTTIACSKSEMEEFHRHNIPAQYINNGIACETHYDHLNKNNRLKVGTIGRITYQKNPSTFNKIAKHFLNNKSIEFIWIGGGGELENQLSSPNIIKTGWLSREDVNIELSKIDIYLSTSLWEGLPLSVLQAMCLGKPLLLSNCIGNRNLVKENYNGILFNDISECLIALQDMMDHPKNRRKEMRSHSIEIVKKDFSIEQMIDKYKLLYKNCVEDLKQN